MLALPALRTASRAGAVTVEAAAAVEGAAVVGDAEVVGASMRTGTVWDDIVPAQPNYPGGVLPRSFEMAAGERRVWVHGNATEHLAELAAARAELYTPDYIRLLQQQQLCNIQSAVRSATESGVPYGRAVQQGGWELRFAPPRGKDQLPVLFHAQPL